MKIEELKKTITQEAKKPFNINKKVSKISLKYWKNWYAIKFQEDRTVVVNIELLNGMHKSFLISEKHGGFKYKGGTYLLDDDLKYYNIDAKMYAYDYHVEYALPLMRKIPMTDIKKTLNAKEIKNSKIGRIEYASNPLILERFIQSKVIEGIMRGQQLDETLRMLKLLAIIIVMVVVIHLLLFMQKSGMFDKIAGSLPF